MSKQSCGGEKNGVSLHKTTFERGAFRLALGFGWGGGQKLCLACRRLGLRKNCGGNPEVDLPKPIKILRVGNSSVAPQRSRSKGQGQVAMWMRFDFRSAPLPSNHPKRYVRAMKA
jgi:hypothetical protein